MATRAANPTPFLVVCCVVLPLVALLLWPHQGSDADTKVVNVYTAHNREIIDALLPEFERKTGIRVNVVKLGGSGDVIRRVRAEADQPKCDVIWSIAADQLHAYPEVLTPTPAEFWEPIAPTFHVGNGWAPYTGLIMVFIVNTDLLKEHEIPRRWTDLARADLKDRISSARATKSGTAYMQLRTVLSIYPERGWEVYRGILANLVLSPSSSAVSRLVNDGELAVGITIEDNAYRYVKGGGPVRIVYPEDGTVASNDGCALVKGGPHPQAAKSFLAWALSRKTQDALVDRMGRRPVRRDGRRPGDLPPLSEIKTIPYDFDVAAAKKDESIKRWTELVVELGR
jgi:iron(III) transport system substrate-binding protein